MVNNNSLVGEGLEVLRLGLASYVERELQAHYGDSWWDQAVNPTVRSIPEHERLREVAGSRDVGVLDVQALLCGLGSMEPGFQVRAETTQPNLRQRVA